MTEDTPQSASDASTDSSEGEHLSRTAVGCKLGCLDQLVILTVIAAIAFGVIYWTFMVPHYAGPLIEVHRFAQKEHGEYLLRVAAELSETDIAQLREDVRSANHCSSEDNMLR